MAHIPDINIQEGRPGRIIVHNSDGVPRFVFSDHNDLYSFIKRTIEVEPCISRNYTFVDKDAEYCIKDIPCNKVPYSSKRLHADLDPEKVKAAIAEHKNYLKDFIDTKIKEVTKPMEHTNLSKTVYIFTKEWDFSWSEDECLVARRSFDLRDDLDDLLACIREADYVMIVPDDFIQDTARFVEVTGYDVHYELGDNELALNMSVTHA